MQISMKFSMAVHMLAATAYFDGAEKVTSDTLAESVGSHPVIIRNLMVKLREAGLISVRRGHGGVSLAKAPEEITFRDIYNAVENTSDGMFRFHANPSEKCPVGKNIHAALDPELAEIGNRFEDLLAEYTLADVMQVINEKNNKRQNL